MESVQTFGRKKTAVAVAYCKKGRGLIKINGCPIELVEPEMLRYKVFEPILLLGRERFANVDIRLRVKGGGYTSQIYAIRQALTRPTLGWECRYSLDAVDWFATGGQVGVPHNPMYASILAFRAVRGATPCISPQHTSYLHGGLGRGSWQELHFLALCPCSRP